VDNLIQRLQEDNNLLLHEIADLKGAMSPESSKFLTDFKTLQQSIEMKDQHIEALNNKSLAIVLFYNNSLWIEKWVGKGELEVCFKEMDWMAQQMDLLHVWDKKTYLN